MILNQFIMPFKCSIFLLKSLIRQEHVGIPVTPQQQCATVVRFIFLFFYCCTYVNLCASTYICIRMFTFWASFALTPFRTQHFLHFHCPLCCPWARNDCFILIIFILQYLLVHTNDLLVVHMQHDCSNWRAHTYTHTHGRTYIWRSNVRAKFFMHSYVY